MKRYLGAFLAAGLVFTAVSASASSLTINNAAPLQVGTTMDLVCDGTGVDATVGFPEHDQDPGRSSTSVTVSEIDEECFGHHLTVIALDKDEKQLSRAYGVIDATSETINWGNTSNSGPSTLDPADIYGLEIHING